MRVNFNTPIQYTHQTKVLSFQGLGVFGNFADWLTFERKVQIQVEYPLYSAFPVEVLNKKTGEIESVNIEKHEPRWGAEEYFVIAQDGENYGGVSLRFENKRCKNEYGDVFSKKIMEIENIHGCHSDLPLGMYKGIGTKLMQLAYERSVEEGCKGGISLRATADAYKFYKKLGLEVSTHQDKEKMEKEVKHLGRMITAVDMHFSPKSMEIFDKKVQEDPILKSL